MSRIAIRRPLLLTLILLTGTFATASVASPAGASPSAASTPRLLALGHFRLGGGGLGRRPTGFGRAGRRSSQGFLRRVARALAFAYILHLLFSHGGLSVLLWLIVIGLVVLVVRRRRRLRGRYSY